MGDNKQQRGTMQIDADLVRGLAQLLSENSLTEIEVEDGDRRIRVRRESVVVAAPATQPVAAAAPSVGAAGTDVSEASPPVAAGETVKSPMVGTAFLSSEPGSDPFVSVGDTVKAGDTLLIVEAMKVMNPIVAPNSGTVRQLLVADAQPVEFDQPLVVIG